MTAMTKWAKQQHGRNSSSTEARTTNGTATGTQNTRTATRARATETAETTGHDTRAIAHGAATYPAQ